MTFLQAVPVLLANRDALSTAIQIESRPKQGTSANHILCGEQQLMQHVCPRAEEREDGPRGLRRPRRYCHPQPGRRAEQLAGGNAFLKNSEQPVTPPKTAATNSAASHPCVMQPLASTDGFSFSFSSPSHKNCHAGRQLTLPTFLCSHYYSKGIHDKPVGAIRHLSLQH